MVKPKSSEKVWSSTALSTTNPTWPYLGFSPGRGSEKPATNSHFAGIFLRVKIKWIFHRDNYPWAFVCGTKARREVTILVCLVKSDHRQRGYQIEFIWTPPLKNQTKMPGRWPYWHRRKRAWRNRTLHYVTLPVICTMYLLLTWLKLSIILVLKLLRNLWHYSLNKYKL
jgi:hypothetical protein